jgi:IS6 family transposase
MILDRRNTCAAHRFLGKALKTMRNWPRHSITSDKLGFYSNAIRRLQREGKLPHTKHCTSKYLNNLKQVIRPARGFQTMRTASATIKGFEVMRIAAAIASSASPRSPAKFNSSTGCSMLLPDVQHR